jgi:hypothetical protein
VHTIYQDKGTYIFKDLNGAVFRHIITDNNLKPFRVRTAYINIGVGIGSHETTTLLWGDETNDNETDQAEDETAALEVNGEDEVLFSDESYIPEDRIFAVVV